MVLPLDAFHLHLYPDVGCIIFHETWRQQPHLAAVRTPYVLQARAWRNGCSGLAGSSLVGYDGEHYTCGLGLSPFLS